MAAGVGVATVVLAVVWLFSLIAVNDDPTHIVGDGLQGHNPSGIAVYSAFAAFLLYIAGIILLYMEVLVR